MEFIDDVNQDYHYNQFSALTLTDATLLNLNMQASMAHVQVLRDFIMKRNFTLILKSTALDPLVLRGPITKIFGQHLSTEDLDMKIDQYTKLREGSDPRTHHRYVPNGGQSHRTSP